MKIRDTKHGKIIDGQKYTVLICRDKPHKFKLRVGSANMFDIPFIASLTTTKSDTETISDIQYGELEVCDNCIKVIHTAKSSIWESRQFHWEFREDSIEFFHTAKGHGDIERCFFFSTGISETYNNGTSMGFEYNTISYAKKIFNPKPNLGNVHYYDISTPQSLGIRGETPMPSSFAPAQWGDGLFCPPLMCLCFGSYDNWAGIGIGDVPGRYRFNSLEYSGSRFAGCSFHVNYFGYTKAEGMFESPKAIIAFGEGEYATLEKYTTWLDDSGFSTQFRYPSAKWHRMPFFCGWGEQTHLANRRGTTAGALATQAEYEHYLAQLNHLPIGNIVIDDKWQKYYGTFEVDTDKWPDMKGFISKQHSLGRHVLLWVPGYHKEGLPDDYCILDLEGKPICADATNPEYEKFLREQIKKLIVDYGADGFKEDWIGGISPKKGLRIHEPIIGIEFLRKFQFILHDEAHKWKADALIETQTPFPLFRESSDMIRLNDLWYGTRDVVGVMRTRAKLAKLAGWELVDCDNGSNSYLDMWFEYMLAQPEIGVPALYCVTSTEVTFEDIPTYMLDHIANVWHKYINENV